MKLAAKRGKEGELRAQESSDSAMSEGKKPYRLLSYLAIIPSISKTFQALKASSLDNCLTPIEV